MKLKLYLDFDGVILDTINIACKRIKELNITEEEQIQQYYKNIDWVSLLKETNQINNSIENIKKIIKSNLYDVEILTHVNSELEGKLKKEYIQNYIPEINVIPVFKTIDKCDAVNPINCILIDDYLGNLTKWNKKGGISIKFSDNNKISEFTTIDNLDIIIDMYDKFINIIENKQVITNE